MSGKCWFDRYFPVCFCTFIQSSSVSTLEHFSLHLASLCFLPIMLMHKLVKPQPSHCFWVCSSEPSLQDHAIHYSLCEHLSILKLPKNLHIYIIIPFRPLTIMRFIIVQDIWKLKVLQKWSSHYVTTIFSSGVIRIWEKEGDIIYHLYQTSGPCEKLV